MKLQENNNKNNRKTTKWTRDRQPSRKKKKERENNDREDDPGSWEKHGDHIINVYERHRIAKEQINRDEHLIERNQ